jgi:hypothetical protein
LNLIRVLLLLADTWFDSKLGRWSPYRKPDPAGPAFLARARGETAALRSLANAARMMDDNPNLLQMRA